MSFLHIGIIKDSFNSWCNLSIFPIELVSFWIRECRLVGFYCCTSTTKLFVLLTYHWNICKTFYIMTPLGPIMLSSCPVYFSSVKWIRLVSTLPSVSWLFSKSRSLHVSQPYRPPWPFTEIASPFYLYLVCQRSAKLCDHSDICKQSWEPCEQPKMASNFAPTHLL
jgi:hypothetical protein